jgi:cobaltochelatase CobS
MSAANTLMGMGLNTIAAAYWAATGQKATNNKAQMVAALAAQINAGLISLNDIRRLANAGAGAPAPIPAPVPAPTVASEAARLNASLGKPEPAAAPADAALEKHTRQTAAALATTQGHINSISQQVTQASLEIQSLDQRLANLGQQTAGANARLGQVGTDIANLSARLDAGTHAAQAEAKSLRAQVQVLADSVGQITMPVEEIRAAMRQAVADAWGPVRAAAEANGTEADVRAQVAGPAGRASALDVFGVDARDARGRPLMFSTWADTAPPVDSCHIWTEPVLRMLALAEATGRNAWLAGPAGVGKSQTVQQYAARTGRAFERFQMHKLAGVDDFLGAVGIKGGDTVFQPGPILRAFTTPGAVCLIDEPATGSPAVMAVLNGLLEPGQPRISHGEKVYTRATGTLFFGADNSNGQGDTGGRFAGVQQMNTATMDRFSFVVPLTYLDPSDEAAALVLHTGCTQKMADHVIQAFTLARSKVETGDLIDPPTFRQAIAFTQACTVLPPSEAWRVTIAARQPMESQVALAAIYSAAIDETIIAQEAA